MAKVITKIQTTCMIQIYCENVNGLEGIVDMFKVWREYKKYLCDDLKMVDW